MSHITPFSCVLIISLTILVHLPLKKCEEESEEVEVFYARDPLKIKQLSFVEENLVVSLSEIASSSSSSNDNVLCLDYVSKYILEYEHDELDEKDGSLKAMKISDNPLLTFKLIKRLYLTLMTEVMTFCEKSKLGVKEKIGEVFKTAGISFPVERDWDDALNGMIILQFVYDLKTEQLRVGILNGTETNVVLYGDHCLAIAKKALQMEGAVLAYQWLKQAELSYLEEESVDINGLEKTWERLLNFTGLETLEQLHSNITNERQDKLKGYATLRRHAPCRGEVLMDLKEQAETLKCLLFHEGHPYFAINPLKIEILSERYMYLQLHDFVGAKAIETIRGLEREDDMKGNVNSTGLLGLLKTIEMTTGMSYARWRTGYWFSTISTPLGGYCNVQSLRDDKYQPTFKEQNKLTTLLLFLNDVKMGGYASFQKAGIAAKPIKGSALFYYNNPDEMEDLDKTILRCPVLMGVQETATQWMLKSENKAT